MHYIAKSAAPECLKKIAQQHQRSAISWREFPSACKTAVNQQALVCDQQGLCGYCEKKLENVRDTHIEHICPQSKEPAQRFSYQNMIVSCNGGQCSEVNHAVYDGLDIHSCGHRKDNAFDAAKFLNPVALKDISDYFSYDIDTACIRPSSKEDGKAKYTIELLNLDNDRLRLERLNAKIAIIKALKASAKGKSNHQSLLHRLLTSKSPPGFISYLRYAFRTVI